jgi:hypothetical protein
MTTNSKSKMISFSMDSILKKSTDALKENQTIYSDENKNRIENEFSENERAPDGNTSLVLDNSKINDLEVVGDNRLKEDTSADDICVDDEIEGSDDETNRSCVTPLSASSEASDDVDSLQHRLSPSGNNSTPGGHPFIDPRLYLGNYHELLKQNAMKAADLTANSDKSLSPNSQKHGALGLRAPYPQLNLPFPSWGSSREQWIAMAGMHFGNNGWFYFIL